jgi:hypothetical protein
MNCCVTFTCWQNALAIVIEIVPTPDTTGSCGISKGPASIGREVTRLPSADTSNVEGTATEQLTEGVLRASSNIAAKWASTSSAAKEDVGADFFIRILDRG